MINLVGKTPFSNAVNDHFAIKVGCQEISLRRTAAGQAGLSKQVRRHPEAERLAFLCFWLTDFAVQLWEGHDASRSA